MSKNHLFCGLPYLSKRSQTVDSSYEPVSGCKQNAEKLVKDDIKQVSKHFDSTQ